jgi:tetratricopeptide (TPR) repeat protein
MSFHDKTHAGKTGPEDAHPDLAREKRGLGSSSSAFARWLLPAISLAFACAGLSILVVQNFSASPDAALADDRPKAPLRLERSPPLAGQGNTNQTADDANPDLTVKLVTEGNKLLQQGNYSEALRRYDQALQIDPADEDLHYNVGIALAKLGRIEEAKRHYEEALRIFPDYVEVHNNLGNLLMNERKLAEAIEHFQQAIRIMPENASAHNNLGTALGRQGKVNEAVSEFAQAVKLKPAYVEARVNLANAYLVQEQLDGAIAELTEALRLQPDFPPAINAMNKARQRQSSGGIPK